MKKYTSPRGWKVVPMHYPVPELFISPEGITYKRRKNREKIDVTVRTKYGLVELREWYGCPQELRTPRYAKHKLNKRKHQKKKK